MPSRFHGRGKGNRSRLLVEGADSTWGEWWAAIAILALAALGIASLSGSSRTVTIPRSDDPVGEVLAAISPAERDIAAVSEAFAALCKEPVLLAVELAPDCETGVITLGDPLFDGFGSAVLRREAQQDLLAAMRIYLASLRKLPSLWSALEAIEIRGHSDPRAVRSPYTTNLIGSQQRPIGVLLFLVGPNGLGEADRVDFERLAVASGVSFSRPPASCPERTRECYREWRRVEIRPVLSESRRRQDWSRSLDRVRVAAAPTQDEE